jgi:tripartite-type tricarboxylate transporter receptor subunit TctC
VLVTRKDFPARTLKDFVAYAKANQSKLNMAHAGVGSVSYVGCLLLNTAIGIKPTLVPFTGSAPATNALMAGQVDYFCDPIIGQLAQISAGNVHALAIAAAARHPLLANVPTAAEEGLPQFNIAPFFALFAPKARRSQSSTCLPRPSTRRWTIRWRASGSPNSAPRSPRRAGVVLHRSMRWSEARLRG